MGLGSHIEISDNLNWMDRSKNTPPQSPKSETEQIGILKTDLEILKTDYREIENKLIRADIKNNKLHQELNSEKQKHLQNTIDTLIEIKNNYENVLKNITDDVENLKKEEKHLIKSKFQQYLNQKYKNRKTLKIKEIYDLFD
jgi:predicted  nucleic acid-binding Zn-ribbon protein